MGFKKTVGRTLPTPTSVKKWIGAGELKKNGNLIMDIGRSLFEKPSSDGPVKKESFVRAMQRMNMDETKLQQRLRNATLLAYVYLASGAAVLLYMFYLFSRGEILSGLTCMMLSLLMFAYSFREHFECFRMRRRSFDCTVSDWFLSLFKKG